MNSKVQRLAGGQDSALLQRQQKIVEAFEERENEREKKVKEQVNRIEQRRTTLDSWKVLLMDWAKILALVAVMVVIVRALAWGIWDGLWIGAFFEWGSQWLWLKITMIVGLAVGAIIIVSAITHSVKEFLDQ